MPFPKNVTKVHNKCIPPVLFNPQLSFIKARRSTVGLLAYRYCQHLESNSKCIDVWSVEVVPAQELTNMLMQIRQSLTNIIIKIHELTTTYIRVIRHIIVIKFLLTIPQVHHLKNNNATIISKQHHKYINKHTSSPNSSATKEKMINSQVRLNGSYLAVNFKFWEVIFRTLHQHPKK